MQGILILSVILAFLPFIVSLGGRGGVWKFLSLLFCCFSLIGIVPGIGFAGGIFAWVIAWIFTAVAAQSRRSEERFARMERSLATARAMDAESPVGRLLADERRQKRFISFGQVVALLIVFAVAGVLLTLGFQEKLSSANLVTGDERQTVSDVIPAKIESASPSQTRKCRAADFTVEGFSPKIFDDCKQSSCPALKLTGKLKNNCALAAGAQIKITAEDAKGGVVDTVDGWPASTRNIAAGSTYAFDMGPLMVYRKGMKTFKIDVIDARTW